MAKKRNKRATNERTNKQLSRAAIQSNRSSFKIESERERELKNVEKNSPFLWSPKCFQSKIRSRISSLRERVLSLSLSLL